MGAGQGAPRLLGGGKGPLHIGRPLLRRPLPLLRLPAHLKRPLPLPFQPQPLFAPGGRLLPGLLLLTGKLPLPLLRPHELPPPLQGGPRQAMLPGRVPQPLPLRPHLPERLLQLGEGGCGPVCLPPCCCRLLLEALGGGLSLGQLRPRLRHAPQVGKEALCRAHDRLAAGYLVADGEDAPPQLPLSLGRGASQLPLQPPPRRGRPVAVEGCPGACPPHHIAVALQLQQVLQDGVLLLPAAQEEALEAPLGQEHRSGEGAVVQAHDAPHPLLHVAGAVGERLPGRTAPPLQLHLPLPCPLGGGGAADAVTPPPAQNSRDTRRRLCPWLMRRRSCRWSPRRGARP